MPLPNQGIRHCVDVAGMGFAVLDRIYTDGDLAAEALGGSCGNVLVSLAMLHRSVTPVLVLGMDDTGERLVAEFRQAGANVRHIHRRIDLQSPVLAQELDTATGQHHFSFICPETKVHLPRCQPIGEAELVAALPVLTRCSVFYADRLSKSILEAMKTAWTTGATIFFEPSQIEEEDLFNQALEMVSILKYSAERLGKRLGGKKPRGISIVTHGAGGLEIADEGASVWCSATLAPNVKDACGSGDMVSVGVIDWMLANRAKPTALSVANLLKGVIAGQRLAAENCGYAGARGVFKERGAAFVRQLLTKGHTEA